MMVLLRLVVVKTRQYLTQRREDAKTPRPEITHRREDAKEKKGTADFAVFAIVLF
jgi:hypothetical protein